MKKSLAFLIIVCMVFIGICNAETPHVDHLEDAVQQSLFEFAYQQTQVLGKSVTSFSDDEHFGLDEEYMSLFENFYFDQPAKVVFQMYADATSEAIEEIPELKASRCFSALTLANTLKGFGNAGLLDLASMYDMIELPNFQGIAYVTLYYSPTLPCIVTMFCETAEGMVLTKTGICYCDFLEDNYGALYGTLYEIWGEEGMEMFILDYSF